MNLSPKERFDELDAARVLGDITAEEHAEFEALKQEHGFEPDGSLDWIAAGLEESFVTPEALSTELTKSLEAGVKDFVNPSESVSTSGGSVSNLIRFFRGPNFGWALAACLALAFIVIATLPEQRMAASQARAELLESSEVTRLPFQKTEAYPTVAGDVVWSDQNQEGYLSLTGLKANDPLQSQYQLWIVDPERDEVPVDGGVFDIEPGRKTVTIPIRAALRVEKPVAFVITEEQPGGVVVSKQERVAAIAARS